MSLPRLSLFCHSITSDTPPKYLTCVFIFVIFFVNVHCQNSPKNVQKNPTDQNQPTQTFEQESQILKSNQEIQKYINILDVSHYTDEDFNRKSKYVVKNISNKTITNIRITHMYFRDSGENVKVIIKPGQTKTFISNIDLGGIETQKSHKVVSAYSVSAIRFSDGSTIGY